MAPFAEAGNHLAVVFAWTLFNTVLISAAEKHDQGLSGSLEQTLRLAELTIGDSLADLWEKVRGIPSLVEGNPLAEPEIRGWRHATLTGALACLAFFDDVFNTLNKEHREDLASWLESPAQQFQVWGEGAIPPLIVRAIWGLSHRDEAAAKGEIAVLAAMVIAQNQPKSLEPLGNPTAPGLTWCFQRLDSHWKVAVLQLARMLFVGVPTPLKLLCICLLKRVRRQVAKKLWPAFTRITHHVCLHDEAWQYALIRTQTGANQTRIYPPTYLWKTLREEAEGQVLSPIPELLKAKPWLLALHWQFAPWRFTTDSCRVFLKAVWRNEDARADASDRD